MIQLTDTIFAVEVPSEYNHFKISGTNYLCGLETTFSNNWQAIPPRLGETGLEPFKILGTATPTEIDFDLSLYDSELFDDFCDDNGNDFQLNYVTNNYEYDLGREGSFRSLLTSKGITTYEKLVIVERV